MNISILSHQTMQTLHNIRLQVVHTLQCNFSRDNPDWYEKGLCDNPTYEVDENELEEIVKDTVKLFQEKFSNSYIPLASCFENNDNMVVLFIMSTFNKEDTWIKDCQHSLIPY